MIPKRGRRKKATEEDVEKPRPKPKPKKKAPVQEVTAEDSDVEVEEPKQNPANLEEGEGQVYSPSRINIRCHPRSAEERRP
jgi:hypothetical protein